MTHAVTTCATCGEPVGTDPDDPREYCDGCLQRAYRHRLTMTGALR